MTTHRHPITLVLAAALAAACFSGTSRTAPDRHESPAPRHAQREAARTDVTERARQDRAPAPHRSVLLASPFGPAPMAATESVPTDPRARTRASAYIARAEALDMSAQADGDTVWADVGCCSDAEVDVAEGIVHGEMAARDLPPDAPVFVDGRDARHAARLADRLSDGGLTRVMLVTR